MRRGRAENAASHWQATGAVCCFAGGIGAGLLGSVLTASTWILGAEAHPWVRGLGTAFLILTIPLLILAGYCMDWAERAAKNSRDRTPRNEERGSASLCQALVVAMFLAVIFIAPLEHRAQLHFFNVPTTEVLTKGKVYAVGYQPEDDRSVKNDRGSRTQTFHHRSRA